MISTRLQWTPVKNLCVYIFWKPFRVENCIESYECARDNYDDDVEGGALKKLENCENLQTHTIAFTSESKKLLQELPNLCLWRESERHKTGMGKSIKNIFSLFFLRNNRKKFSTTKYFAFLFTFNIDMHCAPRCINIENGSYGSSKERSEPFELIYCLTDVEY